MKIFLITLFLLSQQVVSQSDGESTIRKESENPLTDQEAIDQKEALLTENRINLIEMYVQLFRNAQLSQRTALAEIDMVSIEDTFLRMNQVRRVIEEDKDKIQIIKDHITKLKAAESSLHSKF